MSNYKWRYIVSRYRRIFCFVVLALLWSSSIHAQQKELDAGIKYEINNITVAGAQSYNDQTVIAFTGLKKGERIFIPGERLSEVTKKLWEQNLFSDIAIYVTKIEGDLADLEIYIAELPKLDEITIVGDGIRKAMTKEIIKETELKSGIKITKNLITTTKNFIRDKFIEKGFYNTDVIITTPAKLDSTGVEVAKDMKIIINRNKRIKITPLVFEGNDNLKDGMLRRSMKNTKKRNPIRIWKMSKFTDTGYKEDKASIIQTYKENGYRDAKILDDSVYSVNDRSVGVKLKIDEGKKYYFGNIRFLGNSVYTNSQLSQTLGIRKGDVYNGTLMAERIEDNTDPEAFDLTNKYQNNGYLFSTISAVEVAVRQDTIDYEIRIREGKQAYFDHITVVGNTKTNDHVIYRELRTRPGQKYSKKNVVRTIRELSNLGFFDPEQISPNFKNVDPNNGTLDMEYSVVEKGASQIELQGGYGGGGFVGTLGLSFNNFSLRNIFNAEAYKPLPMGDGQRLSLRAQASTNYQTYSASITEPWLGGKRPVQFSGSFSHTVQYRFNFQTREVDRDQRFLITGGSLGLAKRLTWPDDNFTFSNAVSFQHYNLKNYNTGLFTFGDGFSNNLAYTVGLSRSNVGNNPIYPKFGAEFKLSAKVTIPYSLFNGVDYRQLAQEREDLVDFLIDNQTDVDTQERISAIDQERFDWLEYYKIKFEGTWYNKITGDLVLRSKTEFGFLGSYNNDRGVVPFERFFVGGDGLGAFSLDGREVVQLRGYPNQSLSPQDGNNIYNKFSLEMRYPITLKQLASIYVLTFIEAGNSYDGFREYDPFDLKRSAGAGLRIFMPAFGLLGIDFAYGFDSTITGNSPNGWETHFIIGQQF